MNQEFRLSELSLNAWLSAARFAKFLLTHKVSKRSAIEPSKR